MRILICNERFLFRFGVDRALIILGKGLKECGYDISIMGNSFEIEVLKTFSDHIITAPTEEGNYLNLNEFTANWLEINWDKLFGEKERPDIVLVGGWPFFASIPFFKQKCKHVIFFDCGAVPLDGFTGGALITQQKLRELRKEFLKETTQIIGISDFIVNTQSIVDSPNTPVKTILLGADHMEMTIWSSNSADSTSNYDINLIESYKASGKKIILCLGRWEPGCYKNSHAAFDIMEKVINEIPDSILLILAEKSSCGIPEKSKQYIVPIGFPGDKELQEIMKISDLGVTFSLWEGFNLPLAEMQWLGQPVLAFDIGAHPEVVVHPWFLCKDDNEMVSKIIKVLSGKDIDQEAKETALKRFHENFKWSRLIHEFREIFVNLTAKNICIFIDVTNATKDTANSGVIRVTRRLSRELQNFIDPIFVIWSNDENNFVFPTKKEYDQLNRFNGPTFVDNERLSQDNHREVIDPYLESIQKHNKWLLFTETVNERTAGKIRSFAKRQNINLAAIFYDAIPVLHPEYCNEEVISNHDYYMRGLSECDIVIPISNFSADSLEDFWHKNNIEGCDVKVNLLPGEFGGYERVKEVQEGVKGVKNVIRILCVSTLEPRKNHVRLIKACLLMQDLHPELEWELILVGNRYAGNSDIPEYIESVSSRNNRINWMGVVDDLTLHQLYTDASFTIYPSIIEGYGMPIMESLWHGKPCICFNEGVMGELAKGGGCFTTNVMHEKDLSEAIYKLATDSALLERLSHEAVSRDIKLWKDYAIQLLECLNTDADFLDNHLNKKESFENKNWDEILYPNCLCEGWQMNHSERMALTALLSRHKPHCSIEIGTYKGGSLSLISQFSDIVFSIDIDPTIPEKFKAYKNVIFLTGPSEKIIPILFEELDKENIPVDFILIDGDHSAEGIKKDVRNLQYYIPKRPMFVMLHDSSNPECRRGMLEGEWEKSPYVDWVDLDFVPGRIVEHGGGGQGEIWGGLGLAYYKPERRNRDLTVERSADTMLKRLTDKI